MTRSHTKFYLNERGSWQSKKESEAEDTEYDPTVIYVKDETDGDKDFSKANDLNIQWHCADCRRNTLTIHDKSMMSFHNFDYELNENAKEGYKLREKVMSQEDIDKWNDYKAKKEGHPVNPNSNAELTTNTDTNGDTDTDPTIMAECNYCHTVYRKEDISKLTRFITRHGEIIDVASSTISFNDNPNDNDYGISVIDDEDIQRTPDFKGGFKYAPGQVYEYQESDLIHGITLQWSKDRGYTIGSPKISDSDINYRSSTKFGRDDKKEHVRTESPRQSNSNRDATIVSRAPKPGIVSSKKKSHYSTSLK